jgi:diguanylate cyclase (GGDEF)-like protein
MLMNTLAAAVYWVIVLIWITILFTVSAFYVTNRRIFGTSRMLLGVLALDALRNIFENAYFGVYFGARFGLFPRWLATVLGRPALLIMPKLTNIFAGFIVLFLLLLKWLPEAIEERTEAARQAAHLHELATIDSMTGLYNRREFLLLAEAEWQRCRRYRRDLALVVLDIDAFKTINDRFGHQTGDQVIVLITKLCRSAKRGSDIAGRMGGEEFAILLPEATVADAQSFAERLRELIGREAGALMQGRPTTVSIGVAGAADTDGLAALFRQADTALYTAKRTGRNRVCCFDPAAI